MGFISSIRSYFAERTARKQYEAELKLGESRAAITQAVKNTFSMIKIHCIKNADVAVRKKLAALPKESLVRETLTTCQKTQEKNSKPEKRVLSSCFRKAKDMACSISGKVINGGLFLQKVYAKLSKSHTLEERVKDEITKAVQSTKGTIITAQGLGQIEDALFDNIMKKVRPLIHDVVFTKRSGAANAVRALVAAFVVELPKILEAIPEEKRTDYTKMLKNFLVELAISAGNLSQLQRHELTSERLLQEAERISNVLFLNSHFSQLISEYIPGITTPELFAGFVVCTFFNKSRRLLSLVSTTLTDNSKDVRAVEEWMQESLIAVSKEGLHFLSYTLTSLLNTKVPVIKTSLGQLLTKPWAFTVLIRLAKVKCIQSIVVKILQKEEPNLSTEEKLMEELVLNEKASVAIRKLARRVTPYIEQRLDVHLENDTDEAMINSLVEGGQLMFRAFSNSSGTHKAKKINKVLSKCAPYILGPTHLSAQLFTQSSSSTHRANTAYAPAPRMRQEREEDAPVIVDSFSLSGTPPAAPKVADTQESAPTPSCWSRIFCRARASQPLKA